jgi:Holliday junction resolvase-like predicted endonuclease
VTNQKGTAQETLIVTWLKSQGWRFARRIRLEGRSDKGDVVLGDHVSLVIESKNEKTIKLAEYMRELEKEIANAGVETGVVIVKKRGTTDVGQYYAVMPVHLWAALLGKAGYGPPAPPLTAVSRRRRST